MAQAAVALTSRVGKFLCPLPIIKGTTNMYLETVTVLILTPQWVLVEPSKLYKMERVTQVKNPIIGGGKVHRATPLPVNWKITLLFPNPFSDPIIRLLNVRNSTNSRSFTKNLVLHFYLLWADAIRKRESPRESMNLSLQQVRVPSKTNKENGGRCDVASQFFQLCLPFLGSCSHQDSNLRRCFIQW